MLKKIKDLMKRLRRQQNGFTLIELAVILAVIGILAGIGVMKYIDVTAGARQTTAQARLADVKSCISMAIAKKGGHATGTDVKNIITEGFPAAATDSAGVVTFGDVKDKNNAVVTYHLMNGTTNITADTEQVTNANYPTDTAF